MFIKTSETHELIFNNICHLLIYAITLFTLFVLAVTFSSHWFIHTKTFSIWLVCVITLFVLTVTFSSHWLIHTKNIIHIVSLYNNIPHTVSTFSNIIITSNNPYKNIFLIVSLCNNTLHTVSTYSNILNALLINIVTFC